MINSIVLYCIVGVIILALIVYTAIYVRRNNKKKQSYENAPVVIVAPQHNNPAGTHGTAVPSPIYVPPVAHH
ncbi:hypothetical protein BCR32DRAFT_327747, partial [Anaeromyces robustus]